MFPEGIQLTVEVPGGRVYQLRPSSEPIPPGAVTESSEVLFHLTGDRIDIFGTDLSVDGVVLERMALSPRHLRWRWSIGFHAGETELCLRGVTPSPVVIELVTDPHTAKLNRSQFARMVGDILADTLAFITLTGHRVGIARGDRPLDYARFEYLRSCFNRIEEAVVEIDRAPWRRLEREVRTVPLGRASGATALELSRASRTARPLTDAEFERLGPTGKRLAESMGRRLPGTVRKNSGRFDNRRREHSDILMVLGMWQGFLVHAGTQLERVGRDEEQPARIALMRRQVGQMGRRLVRLTRLPVFEGVSPSRGNVAPSHLFRRAPAYRRFYQAYRDFLSGLADITGDFLKLPIQRTFDLYELWCFLRLAHAAALHTDRADAWQDAFVETAAHGGLVLRLEEKPFDFGSFTLVFQPLYKEVWRTNGPKVGSFSRPMNPDIVLSLSSGGDGVPRPVVILDAKYRVGEGLNDAIRSIHTYRDALVEQFGTTDGSEHRRTVEAAFLLTPQSPGASNDGSWRDADPPAVFFREGYRDTFRFGAVAMRPGITVEQCRELLVTLLDSCRPAQAP